MSAKYLLVSVSLAATLLFAGCASINSVSITPIPAGRGQVVKAMATKTIFLGFNFENDFVNNLTEDLKRQCPNGLISGILTKDEVIHYFIFHTRNVIASGFCNKVGVAINSTKRGTASETTE